MTEREKKIATFCIYFNDIEENVPCDSTPVS